MVEKIGDLVEAHAALADQIEYHAGIDGSGPCSALVGECSLVAALKEEWSEAKAMREKAEAWLADLEGMERDLAADRSEVEALRATWASWSAVLQEVDAPVGSVPAEARQHTRQIMKKCLVSSIKVTPLPEKFQGKTVWFFEAYTRFDGIVLGGLQRDRLVEIHMMDADTGREPTAADLPPRTIAGGSNGLPSRRDTERAPQAPQMLGAPRRSRVAPRSNRRIGRCTLPPQPGGGPGA